MKGGPLQLIPAEHTGLHREHRHTSYASLLFVLLLCGILLIGTSLTAMAAPPAVNPQSGSVGLSGTVRGPAPSQAAVIETPRNGQSTSSIPITVSGICVAGNIISITKNNVFAGATVCADDGTFSLLVDLFDGANHLIAQIRDALGQSGPDSEAVDVFYNAPSFAVPGGGAIGKQLFLQTDTSVKAAAPGVTITRTVNIVGGIGPYAIEWDWGDGKTSLSSQAIEGAVSGGHAYERPGIYRVIVRATDATGNAAYLQILNVVNGEPETVGSNGGSGKGALPGELNIAWPVFGVLVLMVLGFWVGEWRMKRKITRQLSQSSAL